MTISDEALWLKFSFNVYDTNVSSWNDVPGVYIFASVDETGTQWIPKYINQTKSFKDTFDSNEKREQVISSGATHIHAKVVKDDFERTVITTSLKQRFMSSSGDVKSDH